jgi:hypothetical protein
MFQTYCFLLYFLLKYEQQLRNPNTGRGILELASRPDRLKCGFDRKESWGPTGHSNSLRDSNYSRQPGFG